MIDGSVFRQLERFFSGEVIIDKPAKLSEFVITDYGTQWISPGGLEGLYHRFEFNYENKNHGVTAKTKL